ncbi:MAG: ABC-type uncharacterized transport system, periplasmic component [Oscillospiraceae bacterium]|nr:ABC-type uncharacterized transport system, periplasmic component [Oscillospiraceae bacterium]
MCQSRWHRRLYIVDMRLSLNVSRAGAFVLPARYLVEGKEMKKNVLSMLLCAVMSALLLAGCGTTQQTASSDTAASDGSQQETASTVTDSDKVYKVAIVQLVDNDAFTEMITAFENKMRELGYDEDHMTFDVKNAQGDMTVLNSICAEIKNEDYDLVVPIVTPATQAVVNQGISAPVVFISVTDPVGAGILTDMSTPDKNATGTSNVVPVDELFTLAQKLTPGIKNIGILYCSGEKNAVINAEKAKTYFDENGYTYVETTVANSSEVQQAAQSLAGKVDAIYVPTDSTVQSAMAQVAEAANEAGIPIYGSDPVMVQSGALACVSVSNTQLGERSAEMADEILKGTSVSEVPAEALTDYQYVVGQSAADVLNITLPDDDSLTILEG